MNKDLDQYLSQVVAVKFNDIFSHYGFNLSASLDLEKHLVVSFNRDRDYIIFYVSRHHLDPPEIDVLLSRIRRLWFANHTVTLRRLRESKLKNKSNVEGYSLLGIKSHSDIDAITNWIASDLSTYAAGFLNKDYSDFNCEYFRSGARYKNYYRYIWHLLKSK